MFSSLRFEIIDVGKRRSEPITSNVFSQYKLHICDTIETVKIVLSHALDIPLEYISIWDTKHNFIGMHVPDSVYVLNDACSKKVDENFDQQRKSYLIKPDEDIDDDDEFGGFGGFGNVESAKTMESTKSNFLQENFMFDSTTTVSSFCSDYETVLATSFVLLRVLVMDRDTILKSSKVERDGWISKYWSRATLKSKVQNMRHDAQKYFKIKQYIANMMENSTAVNIKERISIIDYKARKYQQQSKKHTHRYGENIFEALRLSRNIPFISIKIPSLERHQFRMYVGEDTILGVDDVERFIYQTQRVNGLSIRMVETSDEFKSNNYIHLDYRRAYSEITCSNENILLDNTVNNNIRYDSLQMCKDVLNSTIMESAEIYSRVANYIPSFEFDTDGVQLTGLTLKWKLYVPVSRVHDIIDKQLFGALFRKVSLNTSQKANIYISQNFLKYEFDPCIWVKMGNNLSTRIICTLRTTRSNCVIVTIQSTALKRKGMLGSSIDIYLTLWVYDIIRCMILKKMRDKTNIPRLLTDLRLKDIDPYLFGDSVRNGGYTRKCTDWNDSTIGRKRHKQPMVLNMDCPKDMALYNSLKYPSYIIKYRNNCFVGMRDELENKDLIEPHNSSVKSDKERSEYFNTVILFEIHEDHYRAPNAMAGLLYPGCVRRKDRLSRRHIDLMKQAYMDGKIEILGKGKDEIIRQLESHEFNSNDDVGYIMQASRTLPINSFGRLPSDGAGVYEWFRQSSIKFDKGKREFLRKGIMHDDHYNFIHAVFDSLNYKKYQSMGSQKKRKNAVKTQCIKWAKICSFGLFRTLQDGTLAQHLNYEMFINQLKDPKSQLLHTEFSDLISYCLEVNIIIFDCDTYSHSSKTGSFDDNLFLNGEKRKRNLASSAKIYYTTLRYEKYIFLLKMRGIYESIVWHDGTTQQSCFKDTCELVKIVKELDEKHTSHQKNNLKLLLNEIHSNFDIVGQVLNANNQCTHILLKISGVPIPIDGICVPIKNDATKFVPIVKYCKRSLLETFQVLSFVATRFPDYTPEYAIFESRVINDVRKKVIYAIRLKCGLFCDVQSIYDTSIPPELTLIDNMSLKQSYYPGYMNAIILGEYVQDDRIRFIKNSKNVYSTFNFLKEFWHTAVDDLNNQDVQTQIYDSYKMPNQTRRKWLNKFITNLWNNSLRDSRVSAFHIDIMSTYEMELKFVFLNYLFRNPKFFSVPFESRYNISDSKKDWTSEYGENILKFTSTNALRNYLEECAKMQISHLHVTVKKQKRITYLPLDISFVQLDVHCNVLPKYEILAHGSLLDMIFSTFNQNQEFTDMRRHKYQNVICAWLDMFEDDSPIMGNDSYDMTFGTLKKRDDKAVISLGISVILNKTVEVIDLKKQTKSIYGSTLSYSQNDRITILYIGDGIFGKIKNLN